MTAATIPRRIEAVHKRLQKAYALVDLELVESLDDGSYIVQSESGRGYYTIDDSGCTCPDVAYNSDDTGGWCKHRLAAELYRQAQTDTP